jgi:hypothetical protein
MLSGLLLAACLTQPMYASSAVGNGSTLTPQNTYEQFRGPVTLTTGVSCGPKNDWLITFQQGLTVSSISANTAYSCISTNVPVTAVLDSLTYQGGTPLCNAVPTNSPANQVAGAPNFGGTNQTNVIQGANQLMIGHATVPNNTTIISTCWIASTTNNSIFSGFCGMEADPI